MKIVASYFTVAGFIEYSPSIFMLIAFFGVILYRKLSRKENLDFGQLIKVAFVGGCAPTSVILILSPFSMQIREQLIMQGGVGQYLLYAGLALLFVTYSSFKDVVK